MLEKNFNINELYSALFSDGMDRLGYKNQIAAGFQRNQKNVRFMGRVRTIEVEKIETEDENLPLTLNFLDTLKPGEVLVVKGCEHAFFGEMMTRLCIRRGIEGFVIDGITRDTLFTHNDCPLPMVARGYSPQDLKLRGRVKAVDVPIEIDGIEIKPGNLVFVDNDAVCVVPPQIEEELSKDIEESIRDEQKLIDLIENDVPVSEILKQVKNF